AGGDAPKETAGRHLTRLSHERVSSHSERPAHVVPRREVEEPVLRDGVVCQPKRAHELASTVDDLVRLHSYRPARAGGGIDDVDDVLILTCAIDLFVSAK